MTSVFETLARELARLPGIGRRSAERVAFALARKRETLLEPLIVALTDLRDGVRVCRLCGSITSPDEDPCRICSDTSRDAGIICVVEEPGDIMALERSGAYTGLYHALLGRVSPMNGTGPAELRLAELEDRVRNGAVREVLLALGGDVEGDATASMIAERLAGTASPHPLKITRLATGIPVGSAVGYSDPVTLKRAITGRQNVL
ncbi:MAG: recombination mediator RecR [Kiritimatiellaeota bacterium]|nr:recombination mediator RecR [Kiritimatiellota bacterium]